MNTTLSPLERRIGDLDHPWYDDERARLRAYEVYAVGYQMLFGLLGVILLAMEWCGNRTVAWWGCGIFCAFYLPLLYTGTRIRSVIDPAQRNNTFTVRTALFLIVFGGAVLGFSQNLAGSDRGLSAGLRSGLFPGFVTGAVAALLAGWWAARRAERRRPRPEDIPDED